jgi:aryl-alcohol dehydrogenase-like predicted oxidoreductase
MERLHPIHPIASLQPPYSMLRRDAEEELLGYCAANRIGVVVYSPMQNGLLAGRFTRERIAALPADDWRRGSPYFTEPALTPNLELAEKLKGLAARSARNTGELAVAWVLRRPEVTAAIVGSRRPGQVGETIGAADWELAPQELAEIDGVLAPTAP